MRKAPPLDFPSGGRFRGAPRPMAAFPTRTPVLIRSYRGVPPCPAGGRQKNVCRARRVGQNGGRRFRKRRNAGAYGRPPSRRQRIQQRRLFAVCIFLVINRQNIAAGQFDGCGVAEISVRRVVAEDIFFRPCPAAVPTDAGSLAVRRFAPPIGADDRAGGMPQQVRRRAADTAGDELRPGFPAVGGAAGVEGERQRQTVPLRANRAQERAVRKL